jgi:NAD(P)-dependent dehydrogenase (short-subunit alcohol dehydrogenase family)
LVTGSTQGIGRAIATRLAQAGAEVVVNGRTAERVDEAVARIAEEVPDARLRGIAADVAYDRGAAGLTAELPDVDVLVNNLGIFGAAPVLEIDDAEWRRYFDVNVLAGIRLTRAYLPGMTERGFGRVLSISSDSAVATPVEMVHYGVTKTAQLAVTRGFAKAAAGTGVTVNSVLAGPTHTEGVEDFVAELVGDELP